MKKFTLFLSALLISMVSMAAPLGEGYSKVTDITTLAAGDKVVLYCDDAELGVTGYNGNKDATVAATGWVEYIVETAEGGVFLKDEAKGQYVLPASKAFKYASEPSIACNVSSDGILYGVISEQNYYLYDNNGQYYRMYVDKSSDSKYKPFYVYEVTSEGGTTPDDGGETPDDGGETPDDGGETPNDSVDTPELPEGVITCAEAVAICQETGETATTESYTIRGYVTNIAYAYDAGFNNTSFWMADTKDGGKVFEAFRSTPLAEADKAVKVGDYVEVTGNLVNYKGNTPETTQGGTYTILEAAEGGTTPEDPENPEDPEQPETPEEKPLTDGYTKVINISALANGDKVVLYCDAYAVGVAGFDGNKSGIMAETGWVEYVVETVEGGILLKDEAAGKYAALLAKNSFHYADQGSVFNVTENALLATFLESENNTFFLYRNTNSQYGSPLCRMYVDKTGQAEYAPFYVYEVIASTPSAIDNVTVNQNITKFFENGQLVIIKNGVRYNAQGAVVK